MAEKFIIKEVPTTRYIGVERAARGLHISLAHLSMALRGQRKLAAAKAARLEIIRLKEAKDAPTA